MKQKMRFQAVLVGISWLAWYFLLYQPKTLTHETNFKFFFQMILNTSFLSAILYGFAQPLLEKYITIFSFGVLGIIVFSLAGMMRSIAAISEAEGKSSIDNSNVANR